MITVAGLVLVVLAVFGMMIRRTWISLLLSMNILFSGLATMAGGIGASSGFTTDAQFLGGVVIFFGNLLLVVGLALSARMSTRSLEKNPVGMELEKLTRLRN